MNKKTFLIKAFSIISILFIVLSITGCASSESYSQPLNGYSDGGTIIEYLITYPLAYVAYFFGNLFGGYLIVGIFCLTILVRAIFWPIYAGNANLEVKQLQAKPELDKLNMKYANRTDQDSQREKMMEQMAINKKYGINPFKSCLALPIQLLLFNSMFNVLRRLPLDGGKLSLTNNTLFGISLGGSAFGSDEELNARVLCIALAVVTGITTYIHMSLMQKRNKKKNLDEVVDPMAEQMANVMKTMIMIQPIMIAFFAAQSGAMGFYYLVGNCFSIVQTIILNKKKEKSLADFHNSKNEDIVEIL